MTDKKIKDAYTIARERFAEYGIDTDQVLRQLDEVPVSIQCWQGDDVLGFESTNASLTGGIQTTGNYPGRARSVDELRSDLELALSLIPGAKRVNLHAIYLEADKPVERDRIEPHHFQGWVDWARSKGLGLDFNPTCFSHPKSERNLTLSHPDKEIRKFWIDHCIASRKVSDFIGKELKSPAVMNIWIPDGYKDTPADRLAPRRRLIAALDEVLAGTNGKHHKVAVEGKLFGIGAESCTVGTNEFYMAYATTRKVLLCLDAGHFHPTENVADKISTSLCFLDEILLHVSRPVRWDSDHVVLFDDPTISIAQEIVRSNGLGRVHIGLDYFDASINRVAAWVIGTRNFRKALLFALLEPHEALQKAESSFDFTTRMALMEEAKSMPWPAVWDYYCVSKDVPLGSEWLDVVRKYENNVLRPRGGVNAGASTPLCAV
ncbi:MAG TPA: L-rhamnose isomerase [Terracidiphilus sp.]|nr:L-rhamnose isomerase [Terracidiphilus sp.]